MRPIFTLLLLGLGGFVLATPAAAGPVRGALRIASPTGPVPAPEGDHYWRVPNGFVPVRRPAHDPAREIAVVLTGSSEGEALGCRYGLRGGDFHPNTAVARPGTIRLQNHDGLAYTLTSETLELDGSELRSGNHQDVAITAGGPHELRDQTHAHVAGIVHVMPDLVACAEVEADGSYSFPELPPGNYTLKVLRGTSELHSASVTVGSSTTNVDAIDVAAN